MPLDPSIALQGQPIRIDPPMNALMQAMQVQNAQQQNALNTMQAEDMHAQRRASMEQAQARQLALANMPAPPADAPAHVQMAFKAFQAGLMPGEKYFEIVRGPKVARTVDERGADQKLYVRQLDDYGQPVGQPILKGLPLHPLDNGQTITMTDPGAAPGGTTQKLQTPDSVASVSASRENAAATRAVAASNTAAARETAAATRDAAGMQRDQATEMKLADDYRAQSKDFRAVMDAEKRVEAALKTATTSAPATLAAATSFMKLLDPGSVVRESELGMALAAAGVFDRATNYFNTLKNGKVLTPTQAAEFGTLTKQITNAARELQRKTDAQYSGVATRYKLRPENVVQDYGQGAAILRFDANGNPVK